MIPSQVQSEVFYKKGVLKNFAKFTLKHLYQSLFLNKNAGLRHATLLKQKLWYRSFSVSSAKLLGTPYLEKISGRLLLSFKYNGHASYKLLTFVVLLIFYFLRLEIRTQSLEIWLRERYKITETWKSSCKLLPTTYILKRNQNSFSDHENRSFLKSFFH